MTGYLKRKGIDNAIPAIFLPILIVVLFIGCTPKPPKDMIYVPSGDFLMGSDDVDTEAKSLQYGNKKPWFANEGPQRKVYVKGFFIDKYEVSNKRYKQFVDETRHEPPPYFINMDLSTIENMPVIYVSWFDARAFCAWEGKRLPTEAEWEKTGRGTDGRRFPWGNEYDSSKVNGSGNYGGVMDVTSLSEGKSPYGAHHMSGNVYEWTSSWYERYEGNKYNDEDYGQNFMVVRGGSWGGVGHYSLNIYLRTTYRYPIPPEGKFDDLGFRCVKDVKK